SRPFPEPNGEQGPGRGPVRFGRMQAMAISRDEVLHVARLARLELSEDELERFAAQLNAILEAVGTVAELGLEGVEPAAQPRDLVNVWAEDEPRPCLTIQAALANAPDRERDSFRVPGAGGPEGAA